jgi:IrrE N-terminal-like domain
MEIVLMRANTAPKSLRRHERFTVAHELAHALIIRELNYFPRRRAEYWACEDLCNEFASALLIPAHAIEAFGEPATAAELAGMVNDIARRAGVTAEPAARAIVARLETPVAVGTLRLDPLPRTKRLGFRCWWAENRQWWGGRGGRRLAVYEDHPLAPVLRALRTARWGAASAPQVVGSQSTYLRRRAAAGAAFAAVLSEG